MRVFLFVCLGLILSSCGFKSKKEFLEERQEEVLEAEDLPDIKYVKEKPKGDEVDFESIYGKGEKNEKVALKDAIGNLITTDFGGKKLGISIKPSSYLYNTYPAVLSYEENDQVIEKEYGPVAAGDNVASDVTFDIIKSESGPMLLASQVIIKENETSSAYYLYNKYMSLVDSFQFKNSTANTEVEVYRMGNLTEPIENISQGDIKEAIRKRIDAEEKNLRDLFGAYNIASEKLRADIDGVSLEIGHLPRPTEGRIIDIRMVGRDQDGAVLSIK